jgi:hypothetical protein
MFARIGSCLMMDVVHGRLNGSGVGQLGEPYCHCLLISQIYSLEKKFAIPTTKSTSTVLNPNKVLIN